jgi:hypothetical protein
MKIGWDFPECTFSLKYIARWQKKDGKAIFSSEQ